MAENWNSATDFVFFGKGGEIASNRLADQEIAALALHLLQASGLHEHQNGTVSPERAALGWAADGGRLPWSQPADLWKHQSVWPL